MTKLTSLTIPYDMPFGIHVHEVDDIAQAIVNGVTYNFPESGTINPPLNRGTNRVILQVINKGFGWKGKFSLYLGTETRPFDPVSDFEFGSGIHVVEDFLVILMGGGGEEPIVPQPVVPSVPRYSTDLIKTITKTSPINTLGARFVELEMQLYRDAQTCSHYSDPYTKPGKKIQAWFTVSGETGRWKLIGPSTPEMNFNPNLNDGKGGWTPGPGGDSPSAFIPFGPNESIGARLYFIPYREGQHKFFVHLVSAGQTILFNQSPQGWTLEEGYVILYQAT